MHRSSSSPSITNNPQNFNSNRQPNSLPFLLSLLRKTKKVIEAQVKLCWLHDAIWCATVLGTYFNEPTLDECLSCFDLSYFCLFCDLLPVGRVPLVLFYVQTKIRMHSKVSSSLLNLVEDGRQSKISFHLFILHFVNLSFDELYDKQLHILERSVITVRNKAVSQFYFPNSLQFHSNW